MRGLFRFAQGFGLDGAVVPEIFEIVRQEASAAGASDDDRMDKVRKWMLAAVGA